LSRCSISLDIFRFRFEADAASVSSKPELNRTDILINPAGIGPGFLPISSAFLELVRQIVSGHRGKFKTLGRGVTMFSDEVSTPTPT
jgi:hypothetical protein